MTRIARILLLLLTGIAACGQEAPPAFGHKTHATLKMPCTRCHAMEAKGARAGFPGLAECRVCHTKIPAEAATFPKKRVYRVPDFVFFSHKVHVAAKAECARCHGDVTASNLVALEVPPKMKMCVDCHRETKASIDCFICHEIGQ